jgi:hypothetical protein
MKVSIMDYDGEQTNVKLDIDKVERIVVEIVTGDEILQVYYQDGTCSYFESSDCRMADYYDYSYTLYDTSRGINLFNNPRWLNRKNSYDFKPMEEQ